jgi:hypothetical protein
MQAHPRAELGLVVARSGTTGRPIERAAEINRLVVGFLR